MCGAIPLLPYMPVWHAAQLITRPFFFFLLYYMFHDLQTYTKRRFQPLFAYFHLRLVHHKLATRFQHMFLHIPLTDMHYMHTFITLDSSVRLPWIIVCNTDLVKRFSLIAWILHSLLPLVQGQTCFTNHNLKDDSLVPSLQLGKTIRQFCRPLAELTAIIIITHTERYPTLLNCRK